ncbi:single-stranded DNA-binding protein [candidate division KSB1 bacterium]|nr:single-stranded DNA-binding protein [Phycisphaerae bacterium]NIQ92535.1 single-stranded DNA-binding protein [Deltaproteobacteria bacterium]NIV97145.1 single-stranded DNA-binding protein [candidate division KSB1 bacterium]
MNTIIITGNLVRDPEIRQLQSGKTVCNFTIANSRKWKNEYGDEQEDVCFIDCKAFGRTAETIGQYLKKGRPVLIDGRITQDKWQDENGNNRSKHVITVGRFEFIGCKDNGGAE